MNYTSFNGFDGNPKKMQTWQMLNQAFNERGITICDMHQHKVISVDFPYRMRSAVDELPAYKWQDGSIVKADSNANAELFFNKITHGGAVGKTEKLEMFANAVKKELCERTVEDISSKFMLNGYGFSNKLFSGRYIDYLIYKNEITNGKTRRETKNELNFYLNSTYGVPVDVYILLKYKLSVYRTYNQGTNSERYETIINGTATNGRVVNSMLPDTPILLGRLNPGGPLQFTLKSNADTMADFADYIQTEWSDEYNTEIRLNVNIDFFGDFVYTMK